MKTRPYIVTNTSDQSVRLVRAASQAQARNHVAREQLDARPASANEALDLVAKGVAVEEAGAETEPAAEPAAAGAVVRDAQSAELRRICAAIDAGTDPYPPAKEAV